MLSDGYLRWLGISPQGKYPLRFGPSGDTERYVKAWARLPSGVERKATLDRFYSRASIDSLGAGVQSLQRWGFEQGQAALVGDEPLAQALGVTKGGFYWHFEDRRALLEEMLDTWERTSIDEGSSASRARTPGGRCGGCSRSPPPPTDC